jgi:hypothetical protein
MEKLPLNILLSLLQTPAPPFPSLTFLSNQYPLLHTLRSLSLLKHIALFPFDTTIIMMNTTLNLHHSISLTVCTAHHRSHPAIVQSLSPLPLHHPLLLRRQSLRNSSIKQIPVVRSFFLFREREEGTAI